MQSDLDLLRQLQQTDVLFRRLIHQLLPSGSSGHGHGKILYILAKNGPMSQKDLAAQLEIRPQSLTDALTRLEQDGLITRSRSERDKREQTVQITDLGRSRSAELHELRSQTASRIFEPLSQDERAQLGAILVKVLDYGREQEAENHG